MLSAHKVAGLSEMIQGHLSEIFTSFQGEGLHAGRRHLFVRLGGCNLRCRYCDTPDSLERVRTLRVRSMAGDTIEVPNPVSAEQVLAHVDRLLQKDGAVDGVALTGGEPLLQPDFLALLLRQDGLPRPRLLETNGMLIEPLRTVLPWIDVISMDIKLPSNSGERALWDAHARFLALARGKVYVKILVDQGTEGAEIERAAALIHDEAPEAPVFLQPIMGPTSRPEIDGSTLAQHFGIVRRFTTDVRVLPQAHKILDIP